MQNHIISRPVTSSLPAEWGTDHNIEQDLIASIQPIRSFVLAAMIYHLFDSGLYDFLKEAGRATEETIAGSLEIDIRRLSGFLSYLANENLVVRNGSEFSVSVRARQLSRFRSWYTMLIGGYGRTFLQIGECLPIGSAWAQRDAAKVGIGSCGISMYDAIPLTKILLEAAPEPKKKFLDLGCGNALYLANFCAAFPDSEAVGVEPDHGGYLAGVEAIDKSGLSDRIRIVNAGALEFIDSDHAFDADVIILGFVLHEILAQAGRNAVVSFLKAVAAKYVASKIVVIEVDNRFDDPAVMRHELALSYYNPYFLLHYFTEQTLATNAVWLEIFEEANLNLLRRGSALPNVDSTNLVIGYLLGSQ